MKFFRLSLMLVIFSSAVVSAQTSDNPWLISGGLNMVSLQEGFELPLNDGTLYGDGAFDAGVGVPSLSIFRAIAGGLSVGTQLSLNSLDKSAGNGSIDFFAIDAALKYGFNRNGKLSPYVKGGWGFSSFDAADGGDYDLSYQLTNTYFGTFGLNFRLGENWSAFVETSYRNTQDRPTTNYLMHSAGVALGFGSGDSDKDGVNDKKDKCPDVPGLKEFEGCPDTDEDGIPDPEDDCPEDAGPAENNGCPDTDGDTVLDKDDACPEVAGLVELNGCPDADSDGIADKDDECPEEAGPAENNGCPWPDTDGDGVLDKDDACPEEAGSGENGCPEVQKAVLNALNEAGQTVLFAANSSRLMGKSVMAAIEKVKTILDENPEGVVIIEGHASEDGSADFNLKLSDKRANAVRNKLIEMGVDEARLEVKALGETAPVGDNSTREGRKQSRRVVFKAKKQ